MKVESNTSKTASNCDASMVWHNYNETPKSNEKIIVINKKDKVLDFGFFMKNDHVESGCSWAYMEDLIKHTISLKETEH